jgi:hypothetical protein
LITPRNAAGFKNIFYLCEFTSHKLFGKRKSIDYDVRTHMDYARATYCGSIFSNDLKNFINIDMWPGEEAVHHEFSHVTNYRDNHPSTYQRCQTTQSHRIYVKARTGWTVVQRSTTPSGIKRTIVVSLSILTGYEQHKHAYSENNNPKVHVASYYRAIYNASWQFSALIAIIK